jgi:hypothetical protein
LAEKLLEFKFPASFDCYRGSGSAYFGYFGLKYFFFLNWNIFFWNFWIYFWKIWKIWDFLENLGIFCQIWDFLDFGNLNSDSFLANPSKSGRMLYFSIHT